MSALAMTLPQDRTPPPAPETRRARVDATFGMALFIGSWSMAFATLFLTFLILRQRQPAWPPAGVTLPSLGLASLATVVLLASSVCLHAAVRRARAGLSGFAGRWAAGLVLGVAFAALQSWLWIDVWAAGGRPDSGMYESIFYMLTWFHGLHVACGLAALLLVQVRAVAGPVARRVGPGRLAGASNVAIFWHFVDAVWLIMFVSFFV
jgi:heme/copper-type cytochrome/quinol oxidase subunit 3